jgi:hypothetical protein
MAKVIGDPFLDLVAAVARQATKDAKAGNEGAAAWLDDEFPSWRRMVKSGKRSKGERVTNNDTSQTA